MGVQGRDRLVPKKDPMRLVKTQIKGMNEEKVKLAVQK